MKATLPRCGAKCRDGSRCQNPGTGRGGRCPKHGGTTPSGDQWHRVQMPKDERRYQNKLIAINRRRAKLEARIAAMTPEERAKYDKYSRANQPGTVGEREVRRRNREAKKLLSQRSVEAPDPELEALKAAWLAARARREYLEALIANEEEDQEEL